MPSFFTTDIAINLLIGFFYSSILALLIFHLTNIYNEKKNIKSSEVDLTKYTFVSHAVKNSITLLANQNGPKYRKLFAACLDAANGMDNTDINLLNDKTISEFIIFESIPELPKLNDYLVERFIEKIENIEDEKKRKLYDILSLEKEEKHKIVTDNNMYLISYEDLNKRIQRLNERLDYYRYLTKELISYENLNDEIVRSKLERQYSIFKYCIDVIIKESQSIKESLELLDDTVMNNKALLKDEYNKVTKKYFNLNILFTVIVIISSILLIVA